MVYRRRNDGVMRQTWQNGRLTDSEYALAAANLQTRSGAASTGVLGVKVQPIVARSINLASESKA